MDPYVGRSEIDQDIVSPGQMQRMAATLGRADVPTMLPLLWHWMLFQHWALPAALGEDGHPRRGGFLPDPPGLPRRMWAGSRVSMLGELHAGEAVRRVRVITATQRRVGRSGELLFVTVQHEISGKAGLAVRELQDIVYRADGPALPSVVASALPIEGVQQTIIPDPVLLFRYSALTGNGHRIHYDAPYATGTEAYPALVVHGPLIATLLLNLVPAEFLARVGQIDIRAMRPAFCGRALRLCARLDGNDASLTAFDDDSLSCMAISIKSHDV